MPAAVAYDYDVVWDVILDYRLNMWSIENCSFCYDNLLEKFLMLKSLKDDWIVQVLAVSSVWPWIFALTKDPLFVQDLFKKNWFATNVFDVNNGTYEILE